ncbi:hypothetical protein HDU93_008315 [Gonapodya sp. JEL0774]|nr:hypothetical protein HDU93_008315 [Gonapodya sp. JEL0774]
MSPKNTMRQLQALGVMLKGPQEPILPGTSITSPTSWTPTDPTDSGDVYYSDNETSSTVSDTDLESSNASVLSVGNEYDNDLALQPRDASKTKRDTSVNQDTVMHPRAGQPNVDGINEVRIQPKSHPGIQPLRPATSAKPVPVDFPTTKDVLDLEISSALAEAMREVEERKKTRLARCEKRMKVLMEMEKRRWEDLVRCARNGYKAHRRALQMRLMGNVHHQICEAERERLMALPTWMRGAGHTRPLSQFRPYRIRQAKMKALHDPRDFEELMCRKESELMDHEVQVDGVELANGEGGEGTETETDTELKGKLDIHRMWATVSPGRQGTSRSSIVVIPSPEDSLASSSHNLRARKSSFAIPHVLDTSDLGSPLIESPGKRKRALELEEDANVKQQRSSLTCPLDSTLLQSDVGLDAFSISASSSELTGQKELVRESNDIITPLTEVSLTNAPTVDEMNMTDVDRRLPYVLYTDAQCHAQIGIRKPQKSVEQDMSSAPAHKRIRLVRSYFDRGYIRQRVSELDSEAEVELLPHVPRHATPHCASDAEIETDLAVLRMAVNVERIGEVFGGDWALMGRQRPRQKKAMGVESERVDSQLTDRWGDFVGVVAAVAGDQ